MTIDRRLDEHVATNMQRSIDDLIRLCRQPSVAATGEGVEECARLVADLLGEYGFEARLMETGGAPVVYAENDGDGDGTLILYNHYDVQPAEPLELWDTPPFEPTVRDGRLFARGASDDKGELVSRLAALDAVRAVRGRFPCRIKLLIEGEEEIGSIHLERFVEQNRELLAADYCVWEAGGVNHLDQPSMYLGLRGILAVELAVRTARQDAHSGSTGSVLANAAWRLTWALASLKGPDERVRVPGFYDRVQPASQRDSDLLALLPDEEATLKQDYGVAGFVAGRSGAELRRAAIFEPTCTINGLRAGYQGKGTKTVLPCEALAKVDFRLVPDQDPNEIAELLRRHLDREGFGDVEMRVLGPEHPARVDPDHPFVRLAARAAAEVHGREPAIKPMLGGSGPIWPFVHHLGVAVASIGCSYPGANVHAPNEHLRLDLFEQGTRWMAHTLDGVRTL